MINLTKHYNRLQKMYEEISAHVEKLEDKQSDIEAHADDMGRDMTEREQERYDELGMQIYELNDFLERIYDLQNDFEYNGYIVEKYI